MQVVCVRTPRFSVYIESVNCAGLDGGSPGGEMWHEGDECACAKNGGAEESYWNV